MRPGGAKAAMAAEDGDLGVVEAVTAVGREEILDPDGRNPQTPKSAALNKEGHEIHRNKVEDKVAAEEAVERVARAILVSFESGMKLKAQRSGLGGFGNIVEVGRVTERVVVGVRGETPTKRASRRDTVPQRAEGAPFGICAVLGRIELPFARPDKRFTPTPEKVGAKRRYSVRIVGGALVVKVMIHRGQVGTPGDLDMRGVKPFDAVTVGAVEGMDNHTL